MAVVTTTTKRRARQRCINVDWLEVYALESNDHFPVDADYFRRQGIVVNQRDYGSRQWREIFTIMDARDEPMIEVRRHPVSADDVTAKGMFDPRACHIRLTNAACYLDAPVTYLCQFLNQHGYDLQRIFRLDICLDFEYFDSGDDPQNVLARYMAGKYSKVNQTNVSAHGTDLWDGRRWNSLAWGAPTSMVSTKFYNKTMELRERRDKPYIRYAWFAAGLVDDWTTLTKKREDGTIYTPDIWRVEFSIKSSARGWYMIENEHSRNHKVQPLPHTLELYDTPEKLLAAFANLVPHYFHFKKVRRDGAGNLIRKDRCPDKNLFNFKLYEAYRIDRLMTARPAAKSVNALRNRLMRYQETHPDPDTYKACEYLIQRLSREAIYNDMAGGFNPTEFLLLQRLIAERVNNPTPRPLDDDRREISTLIDLQTELF